MSLQETTAAYSFRMVSADVLERGRAQQVQLATYYEGSLVAPTEEGSTFSLIKPDGTAAVDGAAVTVSGDIATYSLSALELPSTLDYGQLYIQRWSLVFGSEARIVERGCSLARRQMILPVADVDITREYPDIVQQLGDHGSNLQGFLEGAKDYVLRQLAKQGQWVDLIIGPSVLYEPIRQYAMYLIHKFLFRRTSGDNQFERLMEDHEAKAESELATMVARFDRDGDGTPDAEAQMMTMRPIRIGGAPRRTRRRSSRW